MARHVWSNDLEVRAANDRDVRHIGTTSSRDSNTPSGFQRSIAVLERDIDLRSD